MSKFVVVRSRGRKPAQHGSYLEKRHNTYYATLKVPKDLRPIVGKSNLFQSLKTDSAKIAKIRVMQVVGEWKELFQSLRSNDDLINSAVQLRKLKEINPEIDAGQLAFQAYTHQVQKNPGEWPVTDIISPQHGQALSVAMGDSFPLAVHISGYEKSLSFVEAKTRDMRIRDVKRFVEKFPTVESATSRNVRDWVEKDLILEEGLSVATCKRIVGALRGFWKYLRDNKSLVSSNPFDDVVPAQNRVKSSKEIMRSRRVHFRTSDYRKLIKAAEDKGDKNLINLIRLASHTGARIEELCSLKLDKVAADRIEIEDAKTPTGWREIPLHDAILDLVATMKEESNDGYLISGLTFNKYGNRSNAIGKRFGRLKAECGFDQRYVFHSFRKSVANQLEAAGIPEIVSSRIIGHEVGTMTYGLYSQGGVTFETKKDALNKISWE